MMPRFELQPRSSGRESQGGGEAEVGGEGEAAAKGGPAPAAPAAEVDIEAPFDESCCAICLCAPSLPALPPRPPSARLSLAARPARADAPALAAAGDYTEDKFVCVLPCGHLFHHACIHEWFRAGRTSDGACPHCRSPLITATGEIALNPHAPRELPRPPNHRPEHALGLTAWAGHEIGGPSRDAGASRSRFA